MDINLLNNYVLKALDAYPFDLEETVENINYALSYDNHNSYALFLMGRVYAEQIGNYEKAKEYYAEALSHNIEFHKAYSPYILVLIMNEDYNEAQKLISYALKVKGVNRSEIWLKQGLLWEHIGKYKKAMKSFKKAQKFSMCNDLIDFIGNEKSRVKNKMKKGKKKSSTKKKRKKKKR